MKELIILGHGPTKVQCDYHCETWGVNNCYTFAPRLDKLFVVDKINEREMDYTALGQVKCIVASCAYPDHPEWNIEVYPIKEILSHFKTNFFSNAICMMMAYALYYGYEKIHFYGIDMMTSTTYLFEKGGVEYWMGIAHAMGVPVINTKESATGKTIDGKIYGYWPQLMSDNITSGSFGKAVAEESGRLARNIMEGVPENEKALIDPDGHLARKLIEQHPRVYKTEVVAEVMERGVLPDLADETRQLVSQFPGFHDESEEWVLGSDGNYVRRKQKIARINWNPSIAKLQQTQKRRFDG